MDYKFFAHFYCVANVWRQHIMFVNSTQEHVPYWLFLYDWLSVLINSYAPFIPYY